MKRKDATIPIALLVALLVHLLILGAAVHAARQELGWWLQSPAPVRARTPLRAVSPPEMIERLGDHDGQGSSINASPGDRPLQSALADAQQEQAILSHDPTGFGGHGSGKTLEQLLGGSSAGASAAHQAAAVFAKGQSALASQAPKSTAPLPVKLAGEKLPAPRPPPPAVASNLGAGTPLPSNESDSFPVTHIASTFVAGEIDARTGRKNRLRKPEFGEAALADFQTMYNPYVVLRLNIDATGNVIDAKTIRSSGSDNIDEPCEVAAYHWWFEPLKDPSTGKPRPETIEFTMYFFKMRDVGEKSE